MHMSYNALSPDTAYSINLLILKARLSNVQADAVYRLDDNEVSYVPQGNLKRVVFDGDIVLESPMTVADDNVTGDKGPTREVFREHTEIYVDSVVYMTRDEYRAVKKQSMDRQRQQSGSKDDPQLHYVQRITIPDSSAVRRKLTNVKDFNKVVIKRKDGKPSKWESTMHLYAGVNTLTSATDDYDVKLWPSLEIGIGPTWDFYPYGKHNVWRAGIGVAWATFRFNKDYFWKKYTKDVIKQPWSEDAPAQFRHHVLTITEIRTPDTGPQARWGSSSVARSA